MLVKTTDGTPDAVKVARPVWSGGKSGDNFKGLPITIIACPMKSRIQINIVIDEIFGNICHYAYKDSVGAVTVRVESGNTPKAVFLTFTDNGIPYNPLDTEDPDITLSSEERKIGGLGIYLVKKNMDEMKYEYVNQQNRLWMEKRL